MINKYENLAIIDKTNTTKENNLNKNSYSTLLDGSENNTSDK